MADRETDSLTLEGIRQLLDHEVEERFVRSIGPDGENPRKKATAVELRFDVGASTLPVDVKQRLIALGGRRVNKAGVLIVVSRRYPSQVRNRQAARDEFIDLLKQTAEAPNGR
jgi:ribosome-associated protein